MTQDEFLKRELDKAKAVALSKWEKMMGTKSATSEGVQFQKWMKKEIDHYAQDASEALKERFRYYTLHDPYGIYNVTYAFILHLIRRNCDVGSQVKSISPKDVERARALVKDVLNMAASEKWRGEEGRT